jgi:muramoyltetrapeptide carboxypeptidase
VERREIMDLLKKGDFIGIVSPGSPVPKEVFDKGVEVLKQMGFRIKLGRHVFDVTGHTAGVPEDRASDINGFFADPEVKAIIATRGGYNCNQILPYLDYELIKKNQKIFLGLSDVTAILNAITSKTGMVTFHGPVLLMIGGGKTGQAFSSYTQKNFQKILMGEKRQNINLTNASDNWNVLKRGRATGRLFGGNLPSLESIIGTPYEPDWEKTILIWETIEERVELIDQMLTHLKLAGIFDKLNGMIIGKLVDTEPKEDISLGIRIVEMIIRQCKEYRFPIVYGVDFGHINDNLILPIGGEVSLDSQKNVIKVVKY